MGLSHILYVGSYASTISSLTLTVPSTSSASLTVSNQLSLESLGSAPSWLTQHGSTIYTADESSQPYALHSSYTIDPILPTTLHFKDTLKVQHHLGPAHLAVSAGHSHLYSANYVSGSLTNIPLDPQTGSYLRSGPAPQSITFTGTGPVSNRQEAPHPHQTVLEPRGRYLLVCDLGSDQIHVLDTRASSSSSGDVEPLESIKVPPGSGPRHLLVVGQGTTQDPTLVYLINELSNTLIIARLNYPSPSSQHLTWDLLQTVSFLPLDQPTSNWQAGELVLSPDRKYLFISNRSPKDQPARNGKDLVSIFNLDLSTGKLLHPTPTFFELDGLHPRHMSLSPMGKYLAVALQHTNGVVVYKRDGGGLSLVGRVEVSKPTCVIWAQTAHEEVGKVVQSWVG